MRDVHARPAPQGLRIVVPQTFGSRLNFNPHLHVIATARCIHPGGGYYESPPLSPFRLRMAWRAKVLALFTNTGVISRKEMLGIRQDYPKGFHVHVTNPEERREADLNEIPELRMDRLARVARYLLRAPFAESRAETDASGQRVRFSFKRYVPDRFGRLAKAKGLGTETLGSLELLARLAQHAPEARRHRVTYYGAYSTRWRGMMKASGHRPNSTSLGHLRVACRSLWRDLIWRVYEADPLACPECATPMTKRDLYYRSAREKLSELKPRLWYENRSGRIRKEPIHGRDPPGREAA